MQPKNNDTERKGKKNILNVDPQIEETPMTMEKKHEMEIKIVGRRRKNFPD